MGKSNQKNQSKTLFAVKRIFILFSILHLQLESKNEDDEEEEKKRNKQNIVDKTLLMAWFFLP